MAAHTGMLQAEIMAKAADQPKRPVMRLMALLERRWTLRLLWELREGRRLTSRELRSACEASPTILQVRLDELREALLVDLAPAGGYGLTDLGRELVREFLPLYRFAERWQEAQLSTASE